MQGGIELVDAIRRMKRTAFTAHRSTASLTDDNAVFIRHSPGVDASLRSSFLVLLTVSVEEVVSATTQRRTRGYKCLPS